jgi:hypothetical protein
MRVPLPDNTEAPVEVANQNFIAQPVAKVECGLILRREANRCCRFCDPISGQCRHLCVRKSSRKTK